MFVTKSVLLFVLAIDSYLVIAITALWKRYKHRNSTKEAFEVRDQAPVFMDKTQTYAFLMEDADGFVATMNAIELQQRREMAGMSVPETQRAYKEQSARTAVSFNDEEKRLLTEAAAHADAYLTAQGLDISILPPWRFALTEGRTYENGAPHIRGANRATYMLSTDVLENDALSMCQLSMTLLYLRMATAFPKKKTYGPKPLNALPTEFPKGWTLPSCGGPNVG